MSREKHRHKINVALKSIKARPYSTQPGYFTQYAVMVNIPEQVFKTDYWRGVIAARLENAKASLINAIDADIQRIKDL